MVAALETLPAEILENLFKPMAMKARSGAADKARQYARSAEEFRAVFDSARFSADADLGQDAALLPQPASQPGSCSGWSLTPSPRLY